MAAMATVKNISNLFLGTCLPSITANASKFKVPYFYFDKRLKMYFRKSFEIHAFDPQKICKTGDVVLIRETNKKISGGINHEVLKIVYPCGDVTDPITGKKVTGAQARDEVDEIDRLYGNPTFNYKKAPKRGWQEGRKDFTHRDSYLKYHEFGENEDNKDQPFSVPY